MSRRSVEDHKHRVSELLSPATAKLVAERLQISAARGRVLVGDVLSPINLPVFHNSQMDGYAIDSSSLPEPPVKLPVVATIAAGDSSVQPHRPGSTTKIMTGAPIPEGADSVVPVEDVIVSHGIATIDRTILPGQFVRAAGADISAGSVLLESGTSLEARHLAALAAVGITSVMVRRRLRVAVITTGAELVDGGSRLAPGQIYDSNTTGLCAALESNDAEVVGRFRVADNTEAFLNVIGIACEVADLVITSGGISVGDFEVVRDSLIPWGADFGVVAMQPGGPQGVCILNGTPIVCFPGNPVSTLVSFFVFLQPELRRIAGLPALQPEELIVAVAADSIPGRRQFLRGRRSGDVVEVVAGPGSHLVAGMAHSNVLIEIPEDVVTVDQGQRVRVWPL
ncbi:MAG: molybdopterin molybdenumtransferase MoeA [Pseudonocardia sp.]|nr:MAG: molybdopterin molybdenumtransferase MoeA [Pseudonocardia sp.]